MKTIRFYFTQIGKRCGYLNCEGHAWLPAFSFEKGNRGVWISCGKIHSEKVGE